MSSGAIMTHLTADDAFPRALHATQWMACAAEVAEHIVAFQRLSPTKLLLRTMSVSLTLWLEVSHGFTPLGCN